MTEDLLHIGSDIPFGNVKWELEKALSAERGDKKGWILSKNPKRLIGLKQTEASPLSIKKRYHLLRS